MRRSLAYVLALLLPSVLLDAAPAADLSMFVKAPPAPAVQPWTGFYIGPHIGYGWSRKIFVDNFPTMDGEIDANRQITGVLGGFQLGYNYQLNWLVLGVEGDFSWSGIGKSDFHCFSFGDQICSAQPQWFADVTGRLGVADGNLLYYVKGGAVWVHDSFTDLATCSGSQPITLNGVTAACGDPFTANHTRLGWLVGGGAEWLFAQRWSFKLEYDYMDFGSRSVTFEDDAGGLFTEEIHQKVQVIKAGLNYHFVAGPAVETRAPLFVKAPHMTEAASQVLGYAGFDAAKYDYSGWVGAVIAPFGNLDTSGFRMLMQGDYGWSKYPGDTGFIADHMSAGSLLAGYGFEGENYSLNLLAGASAINHVLSAIDDENQVQGTAFGVKGQADLRINPTENTLIYTEGDYSTAFRTYEASVRLGYAFFPGIGAFIGPEASAFGDQQSNQWRLGGHVTDLKIGGINIDFGCGYAHDDTVGPSAYGRIEISRTF